MSRERNVQYRDRSKTDNGTDTMWEEHFLLHPPVGVAHFYLLGFWYMSQPFPLQPVHSFIPVDKILKK